MVAWNKDRIPLYLPIVLNNKRRFYIDATGGSNSNSGRQAGAAWQTIAAVNAYSDFIMGDRILFKRGETWTGTRLLVPHAGLLFADYGSGNLPIIDGADTVDCIDVNHCDGLTFQNIECTQGLDYGWLVSGVHDIGLTGCKAHDCGNDNVLISDLVYNVRITDLTSYDAYQRVGGPVISCLEIADGCYNVVVDNALLYGSAVIGLEIHGHDAETIPYDVHILNSIIRNNTSHGLQVLRIDSAINNASPEIDIQNCAIYSNTGKGVNVSKSGSATGYPAAVSIFNSLVHDNTALSTYQVELHGANHSLIRNLINGINERALGLANVTGLTVQNNTIHVEAGSAYVGAVVITDASNNGIDFRNNIVSVASTGVLVMQVQLNAGTGFVADHNLYYTPSGAAANRWSWNGGGNTSFANWKTQSSQDANSPTPADPLYVASALNDFTLQAGSPAINAGEVIVGVTDGYLGAAPDCGAWEKA